MITMPRPKKHLLATAEETLTPPDALTSSQAIARITSSSGKNLYNAALPNGKAILVELEAKFRSTIWIKRGGFVVVDTDSLADRDNKLDGEIVNVVRDEHTWRKMSYWPKEFEKKPVYDDDSGDKPTIGNSKMPPPDSDEE